VPAGLIAAFSSLYFYGSALRKLKVVRVYHAVAPNRGCRLVVGRGSPEHDWTPSPPAVRTLVPRGCSPWFQRRSNPVRDIDQFSSKNNQSRVWSGIERAIQNPATDLPCERYVRMSNGI